VPDYGVTIDAGHLREDVLELTRGEKNYPGSPGKGFLSALGKELLSAIFTAPKDKWLDLLRLLDRMGRERHLQLHFEDERLQAWTESYGVDGSVRAPEQGDFLMLVDTSVNSTKLNLILEEQAAAVLQLSPAGAVTRVSYSLHNPFPEWAEGRDPQLVAALMHRGVYGCYLRLYAPAGALLHDLRIDGAIDGPEQMTDEFGLRSFGRYFPVVPGQSRRIDITYETRGTVSQEGDEYVYRLLIQKQPGTGALPLSLRVVLPAEKRVAMKLDGRQVPSGRSVITDLAVDRELEVRWSLD
jgi:hypothetical protein